MSLRNQLYRAGVLKSAHAGLPTVVIGNVVAGGGGKTPLVIALVKHLRSQGIDAGVVSRGYGRTCSTTLEVLENTPVSASGDEPALIRQATGAPVFVAVKRFDAAQALLAAYPMTHVVLCDDGLQHCALQRDVEVVVFDDRGVGNGWLLPAGPLREPWPARHNANRLLLHTGAKPAFSGFTSTRQLNSHAFAADGTSVPLADLRSQPIVALAAIANPEAFFSMLAACGLHLSQQISLPDHDSFSDFDITTYRSQIVLCTEKDAVKLFRLSADTSVTVLAVPLLFAPESAFFAAFDKLLAPLLTSALSQLPSNDGHKIA